MQEIKLPSYYQELDLPKYSLTDLDETQDSVTPLACLLCSHIPIKPRECIKCRHLFCKACISQYYIKKEKCPKACKNTQFIKISRYVENRINKIKLMCYLCNNSFKFRDLAEHYYSCAKRKLKCTVCQRNVKLRNVERHRKECYFFDCSKCGLHKAMSLKHDCVQYLKRENQILKEELKWLKEEKKHRKTIIQKKTKTIADLFCCKKGHELLKTSDKPSYLEPHESTRCSECGQQDLESDRAFFLCDFCEFQLCLVCFSARCLMIAEGTN